MEFADYVKASREEDIQPYESKAFMQLVNKMDTFFEHIGFK